jgi:hypothetical protein
MKRFIALLRREWIIGQRDLAIYASVIILLFFGYEGLQSIMTRYAGTPFPTEVYDTLFPSFLFIGGIIFTVDLFARDLYKRDNQHTFLMLPASNAEKFLSKSLLAAVGYPIALTLYFIVSSLVVELLMYLIFGNPIGVFNPLRLHGYWTMLTRYWSIISLFILGSTIFRKTALVKTPLAFTILAVLATTIALIFLKLFVAIRVGGGVSLLEALSRVDRRRFNEMVETIRGWTVARDLLHYLIIPIALQTTAYFRLCEVEATDAV